MQPYVRLEPAMKVVAGRAAAVYGGSSRAVIVNGYVLSALEIESVGLPPGRFWYEPSTGLWGFEGRRAFGKIAPNLPMGRSAVSAKAA